MILMQISLYPLGDENIKEHLDLFWKILQSGKINYKINPLSTVAWSDNEEQLYDTVFTAYKKVREKCRAVMVTTLTTGKEEDVKQLLNFM